MSRKFVSLLIVVTFLPSQVLAQSQGLLSIPDEDIYRSRISEYFYMRSGRDILKPVKVLGQVTKPGLYHIPANTSLTGLLALTGGTSKEADLTNITIARKNGTVETKDLMTIVKSGQDPVLAEGDLIFIPEDKGLISPSTSNAMIVMATVLSVALTGYIVLKKD